MFDKALANMQQTIVGKKDVLEKLLVSLLCEGHVLLEDVPGVGKTVIAKTLATTFDLSFSRIQFTPDLLPSDIIGFSIFDKASSSFTFRKGPVHANMVLADEINRASPKTQSSLLEVMQENQITTDGMTYKLEMPFMVIATQNPIEYEGTFPLPEAQLDRFFMRISIGYPDQAEEIEIMKRNGLEHEVLPKLFTISSEDIAHEKKRMRDIYVKEEIEQYIAAIIKKTREHSAITLGASPRASIALYKASKAAAYLDNRDYVIPRDVTRFIYEVLDHRIILKPEVKYKGMTNHSVLKEIVEQVAVPKVDVHG